jgi:Flp pilus assembly protein TadG
LGLERLAPRAGREAPAAAPSRHRLVRRLRDERGQGMVELVIALPVLVGVLFLVVEFGIVFRNWLNVTDAASTAARAAAVARFANEHNCTAANDAVDKVDSGLTRTCQCNPSGSTDSCASNDVSVTVTVKHPWDVGVPVIGVSRGGDLTSAVTQSLE